MSQTSVPSTLTPSYQGLQHGVGPHDFGSYTSEEASAEIPFGVMVKQGTANDQALKLTATTDKLIGVVVHSHQYSKGTGGELGDVGLKPKAQMNIMKRGQIWVPVEEAVTPASAVFVRAVAVGGEVAGAFRDTVDGTDTIDISKWARFLTSTTGAGLALLEFDVLNRSA